MRERKRKRNLQESHSERQTSFRAPNELTAAPVAPVARVDSCLPVPLEAVGSPVQPGRLTAPFTLRSLVLSALLLLLNNYWIGVTEGLWHALHMTCLSLPMNALLILVVLLIFNRLLLRYLRRWALSQVELLIIYMTLFMQSAIIGHDNLVGLMGVLPAAYWYDTPENRWREIIHPRLPDWLVVADKEAARYFYTGGERFYGSIFDDFWLRPALAWTALLFLLFVFQTCLNVLVRRQWAESERLSYPIIQLPMELTRTGSPPFLRRAFWWGFSAAGFVDLVNGLNFLYPSFPRFRVKEIDLISYIPSHPFNAIGSTPIRFYPFIIGFGFLLPLDLCFSCWFFYLMRKVERIFGAVMGLSFFPRFPYENEQAAGAVLAVCVLAVWATRRHLLQVAFKVLGRNKNNSLDDSSEPLSYRSTMLLMVVCGIGLAFWCLRAGMSGWLIAVFFALYFAVSVAVTRIRAEAGPPSHSMLFANPQDMLLVSLGSRRIPPRDLTLMALFWWFNRLNRNHPMPTALECFRIAELIGLNRLGVLVWLWAVTLMSIVVSFLLYPALFYREGAIPRAGEVLWVGADTFNRLFSWLANPKPPDHTGVGFVSGGFLFTLLLGWMRMRFPWWPLHPMGYALGTSYAVDFYWFALLISSAAKFLLVRYGGVLAYRSALPFFIGLVLGECIVACSWSVLGLILHRPMYDAWW